MRKYNPFRAPPKATFNPYRREPLPTKQEDEAVVVDDGIWFLVAFATVIAICGASLLYLTIT